MQLPKISIINISQKQQKKTSLKPLDIQRSKDQGIILHQQAQGVLQQSFVKCILGKPQSGKSTLIQHMIKNQHFYANKFQRILYIGPTIYKKMHQYPQEIIQDQHNWRSYFDIKWILNKIKQCNQWKCRNMLIIFDDVISFMKDSSVSKQTSTLFYNRRHLLQNGTISIIICSQKWISFPKFVRSVVTQLIIFPVNKIQAQSVWKQSSLNLGRQLFVNLISQLKQHDFIYINNKTNTIYNSKWKMI